ncbi:hypothetical protein BGZ94_008182 [Podila epigama]|nr:hypothetical protein BGZ94_008182 [Podila epigama]
MNNTIEGSSRRDGIGTRDEGQSEALFSPNVASSENDPLLVQPTSLLQQQQQQRQERAQQRYEQAHAITSRHWAVLSLACLLLLGNYYCYDIPAALNVQLEEWMGTSYEVHQYQLNMLYSAYSLPNIILPLLGGFLIDKLSASRMLILFSLCLCLGQAVFSTGVSFKSFGVMLLGRFIFGIGGECLEVAQAKITTDWFKSRWLGFALGMNLSWARIGTALNDNISPALAAHTSGGVVGASWLGFGVCVLSLGCGMGLVYLDRPKSRKEAGVRQDVTSRGQATLVSPTNNTIGGQSPNLSSSSLSSEALEEEEELERQAEMAEDDQMHLSEIATLQPSFWILCLCCISLYGAVVPFIHISSDFLQKKWYKNNPTRAGSVMSIPDIISSVGSPLCGYLVDRFGHRARYIPVSALLLIGAHSVLGFTYITPVVGMSVLGLAYSLFASVLWPCIPFLVKDHQLGTAYGLVTIALNISLTIFPMVVASILHATKGTYMFVETLFIGLASIGLILSIILSILDTQTYEREGEEGAGLLDDTSDHGQESWRASIENGVGERRGHDTMNGDEDEDKMVTTMPVGEGIVTIIPHRRRHSIAALSGHGRIHANERQIGRTLPPVQDQILSGSLPL